MSTVALILATALCLGALRPDVARAAAGDLDPSFGTGGVVTASVNNHLHFVGGVALLPDGRIVTAGSGVDRVMLTRHLADGTPDPSFGMSGIVTLDIGGGGASAADGLSVRADGSRRRSATPTVIPSARRTVSIGSSSSPRPTATRVST